MKNVRRLMDTAVSDGVFPGGVLMVSRHGNVRIHQAFGQTDIHTKTPVSTRTLFDLASLTKPLATSLAVLKLMEDSRLSLDLTLGQVIPSARETDKTDITIRQLLCHASGLAAYRPYYKELAAVKPSRRRGVILNRVIADPLAYPVGEKELYSDLGYMMLRGFVETVDGRRLDHMLKEEVYDPLGLSDLFFPDPEHLLPVDRFAATETCAWRRVRVRGLVHDENAHAVGGVDGQAGLFGTAMNVHGLLRELLNTYRGASSRQVFAPDLVREFLDHGRGGGHALGFDRPSIQGSAAGVCFSKNSVGHLGFTGTSFWMDLERSIIIILLTNRIHPSRDNDAIRHFRPALHDTVMTALLNGT